MRIPEVLQDLKDATKQLRAPMRSIELMAMGLSPEIQGSYLHWDELRRRTPPTGLTLEEWWVAIGWARLGRRVILPLTDQRQRQLWLCKPPSVEKGLHKFDRRMGLAIANETPLLPNPELRDTYLVSALVEEAITSSQIEGASTTRNVAREMLRTGRKPVTRDERMISNNFAAMQLLRSERGQRPLDLEFLLELQRVLTEGTLDDSDGPGRLRRPDEVIHVQDDGDGTTLYVPPNASELPARLEALFKFANDAEAEPFLHPVLRAIVLHFALAYEHPFVDGNGRTARALFYWSLLRSGYWLVEFLSISSVIRRAPTQYARAFLFTETDNSDVTYFVAHQLEVLEQALADLHQLVDRKERETRGLERLLRDGADLNHRQRALLSHALRHPHARYTIEAHRQSHDVVYQTARTDLLGLATAGLLDQRKLGKALVFESPPDLEKRLKKHRPPAR